MALCHAPESKLYPTPDVNILSKILEHREPPLNFESVAVTNSSDVHFGNKTYINGPITIIKQISEDEIEEESPHEEQKKSDEPPPLNTGSSACVLFYCSALAAKLIYDKFGVSVTTMTLILSVVIGTTVVLLCILIGLILTFRSKETTAVHSMEDLNLNVPISTNIDKVLLLSRNLRLITRREWLAQPPTEVLDDNKPPLPMVVITHTATENCADQGSCTFQVRTMQTYHIESRGWSDIGYNFLVGGDGAVYEGRGWAKVGAHSKGYNVESLGLAFIGTFNTELPPRRQIAAVQKLMELGVALGKLKEDYKLFGHRQLIPTLSPGEALFAEIKTWPHFSTEL